jgi:hypothetical protein
MRRIALFSTALVLAVAGCSGTSDDSGEKPENDAEQSNAAVSYEELTEPYDLQITPPEGFTEVDPVRDPVLSEDNKTWTYALDGGHADSLLTVSTYYLPADVSVPDFASQSALILEYEAPLANTIEPTNIYEALVHRHTGIHRYYKSETTDAGSLFMRNFFMFAGQHVIQVTCQWRQDFDAITQGCQSLTEEFPFPEGWPATTPTA